MLHITTLKKGKNMENFVSYILLVLSLLNLGLVIMVIVRLGGLRKLLITPIVKKFNPSDFKRKSVDIPKEQDKKDFRQTRSSQPPLAASRPKNNSQQNRPAQRRPAAKAPDVFSNELPVSANAAAPVRNVANNIPPRPVAPEQTTQAAEGRRPLPPRFTMQESSSTVNVQDLAPPASSFSINSAANESIDEGVELDRSKMTHGRRNMVKKAIMDDDDSDSKTEEKSVS